MCGRYSLALGNPARLRERFPIGEGVELNRRFNVAPTDEVLAVTTTREGEPHGELLRWGLIPPWAKDPRIGAKTINARAETVSERPAYREAFRRFRCLIPADGFYEWRRNPDGRKQAFHITRADGEPFAFAGLWSRWRDGDRQREIRSCTIITTAANAAVAPLHDRMPVILEPDQEERWLAPEGSPERLRDLLGGVPAEELVLRPVGPAVNDVRYDGPECLAPVAAATLGEAPDASPQTSMF